MKVQREGILRCDHRATVLVFLGSFRQVDFEVVFVQVQRTMLELLNQLDGFESTSNIKVIEDIGPVAFFYSIFF